MVCRKDSGLYFRRNASCIVEVIIGQDIMEVCPASGSDHIRCGESRKQIKGEIFTCMLVISRNPVKGESFRIKIVL